MGLKDIPDSIKNKFSELWEEHLWDLGSHEDLLSYHASISKDIPDFLNRLWDFGNRLEDFWTTHQDIALFDEYQWA